MFGISGEHLLILGIVLLIFGPRRLPELGNTLGKAIRNFKDSLSGVEEAKFRRLQEDADRAAAAAAPKVTQNPQPAMAAGQSPASTLSTASTSASSPVHTNVTATGSGSTDPHGSGNQSS